MFNSNMVETAPSSSRGLEINGVPTMTERLEREKVSLASRLAEVEAALVAIKSNPEVQKVMDALTKLHWLR